MSEDEVLRRFQAMIDGMGLEDLRALTGQVLTQAGQAAAEPVESRRRPARPEPAVFRLRVDLNDAAPPIWRRLDVRSDLTLDVVHQVLQDAFSWTDSHLHRFVLGADDVWDPRGEAFLCPYDVDDPENEDGGTPEELVRLDETMGEPGDVLRYVYDYGDSWDLTLRLEEVCHPRTTAPPAACVGGHRGAPPEDSGSIRDAESLAEVLDDPAYFDPADVNARLTRPYYVLRQRGLPRRLLELLPVLELVAGPGTDDLAHRLASLDPAAPGPSTAEIAAVLRPHLWVLDRAASDGIPLTAAGYLKPADVEALAPLVPGMAGWIGKANREDLTWPVAAFRESLIRHLGLLRKHRGRLVLTRAGAAAHVDPRALFEHLAGRLRPREGREFERDADLLVLAYAAVGEDKVLPLSQVAATLTDLGYRYSDGTVVDEHAVRTYDRNVYGVLLDLSPEPAVRREHRRMSPVAAALARAALGMTTHP
ncbi:plasmid pRiA4b ORF-3 family protein [Georgenia sp. M64]|uniref:plasmid pRiA4b ORF-3 family protein n=1 Tax=Georgenia sp. M64 TaxID=3120520 RepID=UPI0030DF757F